MTANSLRRLRLAPQRLHSPVAPAVSGAPISACHFGAGLLNSRHVAQSASIQPRLLANAFDWATPCQRRPGGGALSFEGWRGLSSPGTSDHPTPAFRGYDLRGRGGDSPLAGSARCGSRLRAVNADACKRHACANQVFPTIVRKQPGESPQRKAE